MTAATCQHCGKADGTVKFRSGQGYCCNACAEAQHRSNGKPIYDQAGEVPIGETAGSPERLRQAQLNRQRVEHEERVKAAEVAVEEAKANAETAQAAVTNAQEALDAAQKDLAQVGAEDVEHPPAAPATGSEYDGPERRRRKAGFLGDDRRINPWVYPAAGSSRASQAKATA